VFALPYPSDYMCGGILYVLCDVEPLFFCWQIMTTSLDEGIMNREIEIMSLNAPIATDVRSHIASSFSLLLSL